MYLPDPDNLTDVDKYWIGYFRADGCISTGGYTRIAQSIPGPMLEFASYLGLPSNRVRHSTRQASGLAETKDKTRQHNCYAVVHKPIGQIYGPMGVKGDLVDKSLYLSSDFWRGMVDGDGTIHISHGTGAVVLALLATEVDANKFADFCASLIHEKPLLRQHISGHMFYVRLTNNKAKYVAKVLYRGQYSANEVKRLKAEQVMALGYSSRDRLYDV